MLKIIPCFWKGVALNVGNEKDRKTYLKDKYARRLLNAEECQEFVISIISVALDLDKDYVRKNFHF